MPQSGGLCLQAAVSRAVLLLAAVGALTCGLTEGELISMCLRLFGFVLFCFVRKFPFVAEA